MNTIDKKTFCIRKIKAVKIIIDNAPKPNRDLVSSTIAIRYMVSASKTILTHSYHNYFLSSPLKRWANEKTGRKQPITVGVYEK